MQIFLILLSLIFAGCTTPVKPLASETRRPQSDEYDVYKLEVAQSFSMAGLPKPTILMHPGSFHLTISFGKLTRPQFNLILEHFRYAKLPIKFLPVYDPVKSYELIDFLPPKVQALANKRVFETFLTPIPEWFQKYLPNYLGQDQQDHIVNETNCWGTVHDVLLSDRFPESAVLFNYDKITNYYRNPNYFTQLTNETQLRPYDFTLYHDKHSDGSKEVTHASLYLGHGLIYEKEGLSEVDHYRLFYFKPGRENREFFHPIEGVQIKTAEEIFGLSQSAAKISPELARELTDPAKKNFFDSLIFIPKESVGAGQNFFMSTALRLPLRKSTTTGRYKITNPETYPGSAFIGPIPQKPTEQY